MNTIAKNRKSKYVFTVFLTVLLMFSCMFPSASTAKAASSRIDFHGIDITDYESIDVYRMKIPLGQISKAYLGNTDYGAIDGSKLFNKVETEVLIMFTFPNIQVKDEVSGDSGVIYISGRTKVVIPSGISTIGVSAKITFSESELIFSLSNNYYKYLKKINADFSKVQISIGQNGVMGQLHPGYWCTTSTFDMQGIEIYSVGAPPSVFDPDDPDFDIDEGNTGSNISPVPTPDVVKESFWDKVAAFWKALPTWMKVFIIAIPCLIVFGIVIKLIKWVVK